MEEAKFYRDEGVLDRAGGPGRINKATAVVGLGIDPENYDKITGVPTEESIRLILGESYEEIIQVLDSYMDFPENHKKLVAIWILGTYLHETFPTYPFLFVNAMRGSGKTRLLKIISHLAYGGSGMVSTEPTDSVLYRTPKHHTLVFDEFEGVGSKDKGKFRLYLNASYKSGGVVQRAKKVKKKEEENYEIENFEPYKPIAMANIWGMEEVLGDRCITLVLQKSNDPSKTKKIEDFETNYTIQKIKRTLTNNQCSLCSVYLKKNITTSWNNYIDLHYTLNTQTTQTTLTTLEEGLEEMFEKIDNSEIDGRNLELIFPLLITARALNEDIFCEILEICKTIVKNKKEEEIAESKDVALIDFVANAFDSGKLNFYPIREITNMFKAYLNEVDDIEDKWLNTHWIGRALKRLDLIADKRRMARGNEVTLNISKAQTKLKMFKEDSISRGKSEGNDGQG